MKVFAMLCFYILLLYLQLLPVTHGSRRRKSDSVKPWRTASGRSKESIVGEKSLSLDGIRMDSDKPNFQSKLLRESHLEIDYRTPNKGNNGIRVDRKTLESSSLMKNFDEMVKKGNGLKDQYYPMVESVAEWIGKKAQNWALPEKILGAIPILKLVMDNVTPENGKEGKAEDEFGKTINLENTIKHPELIKPLLSDETAGNIALQSVEVAAGKNVTDAVDEFVIEVTRESTDKSKDGTTTGITGEHLLKVIKNSSAIQKLFPNQSPEAAQKMISMLNEFMTPNDSKTKTPKVAPEQKDVRQTNERGGIFSRNFSRFSRSFSNAASSAALALVTTAGNMMTENTALSAVEFFLPVSYPKNVLKFMCILTYLMMVAHREDVMPKIDPVIVKRINSTTGLEISSLIDKLNDKELMEKIFPLHDESNHAVTILKFLAGNEMVAIDKIVDKLRRFKKSSGNETLTISDLLDDTQFFSELIKMPELATLSSLVNGGQQNEAAAVDSTESAKVKPVQEPNAPVLDGSRRTEKIEKCILKNKGENATIDKTQRLSGKERKESTLKDTSHVTAAYLAAIEADRSRKPSSQQTTRQITIQ